MEDSFHFHIQDLKRSGCAPKPLLRFFFPSGFMSPLLWGLPAGRNRVPRVPAVRMVGEVGMNQGQRQPGKP